MTQSEDGCAAGSHPWNSVGKYLRNSPKTKLLSKGEEAAWFQVIDASIERVGELFSRYLFAPKMFIRELERLSSGDQNFDSVVSEDAGMRCASYKKAIPDFCRDISEASDRLSGASLLRESLPPDSNEAASASALLDECRTEMRRRLRRLSFRQSVIEAFCDVAYEDIYLPYVECRKYQYESDRRKAEGLEAMFGMPPEEFLDSFKEIRMVQEVIQSARSKITEANLRLVVHVAKKYQNRGCELADLLQDGSIGLMTAVRKFDRSRGHKFSTFATWWIRQAISRSLSNNARTIRIPSHKVDMLNKLNVVERTLTNSLGRDPTTSEVSSKMGISCGSVEHLRQIRQQPVSLDSKIDGDGDSTVGVMIGDESAENPAEAAERHILCDKVREALSSLSEREQTVISLRFGLADGNERSLEAIGRVFNVTREHIRQIEIDALAKLRQSSSLSKLAELASSAVSSGKGNPGKE